jgi:hypothetical protein
MENRPKELISDIENRFQTILAISIFFPVFLGEYLKVAKSTDEAISQAFVFFCDTRLIYYQLRHFSIIKKDAATSSLGI